MTALVLLPKSHYRDIAQQNWGLTDEQMKGMHVHHRIPEKGIGLFARDLEKRLEDARKAGKIGIRVTLSRNPNPMRDIGLKGGAPGKSVIVETQDSHILFESISKAIKYAGVSRTRAYIALRELGFYQENLYTLTLL